jgi:hypothetical protein
VKRATRDRRRTALQERIAYKPGYAFALGDGHLEIVTRLTIPCADQAMTGPRTTISDGWEHPNVEYDLSTEHGAVVASLAAALTCSAHEVLEWFSLDGHRLMAAHQVEVEERITEVAEALAEWCWSNRKKYSGALRPEREP